MWKSCVRKGNQYLRTVKSNERKRQFTFTLSRRQVISYIFLRLLGKIFIISVRRILPSGPYIYTSASLLQYLYYNTLPQYARMENSGTPRTCKINIPHESILEAKNMVTYVSIFVFRFYFLIRASDKWNYRNEFHSAIYKILVVRCTCTLLTNWIKSLTNVTR